MRATAAFDIQSWEEQVWNEALPKMTLVRVTSAYRGDLEGRGTLQYVMAYRDSGTAHFVGLERIEARLAGRSGSFVLRHTGTFADDPHVTFSIVEDSGTGELSGIRGSGTFEGGRQAEFPFVLDYDFA